MRHTSTFLILFIIILIVVIPCQASTQRKSLAVISEMRFACVTKEIKIGEPLLLDLTMKLDRPHKRPDSNDLVPTWRQEGFFEIVCNSQGTKPQEESLQFPAFPRSLQRHNEKGTEYRDVFILFYDHFNKKLLFDKAGEYRIRYMEIKDQPTDWVPFRVVESAENIKKAARMIQDPNDFMFLEYGHFAQGANKPDTLARLQRVTDESPATFLGKWCAARIGLGYFQEFHDSQRNLGKARANRRTTGLRNPLLTKAITNLTKGLELPDEYPIRRECLYTLGLADSVEGQDEKAAKDWDELLKKYSFSESAQEAIQANTELDQLKQEEMKQRK